MGNIHLILKDVISQRSNENLINILSKSIVQLQVIT